MPHQAGSKTIQLLEPETGNRVEDEGFSIEALQFCTGRKWLIDRKFKGSTTLDIWEIIIIHCGNPHEPTIVWWIFPLDFGSAFVVLFLFGPEFWRYSSS